MTSSHFLAGILFAAGAAAISFPSVSAAEPSESSAPLIYGFMASSDQWRDEEPAWSQYGFYSFRADGSQQFVAVSPISADNSWALNGAVYANGRYYCYSADGNWMRYTLHFRVLDANNWMSVTAADFKYVNSSKDSEESQRAYQVPSDLAYDAVNGKMYAATRKFGSDQLDSYLCTVDPETGILTKAGKIPSLVALTADATGSLLGIGLDGNLYRVAPDGASTVIGHTGYYPTRDSQLVQSATTDYATGQIYWSAMCFGSENDRNYNVNAIYAMIRIDPSTAKSEVAWAYPRDQRFSSVNIKSADPQAPGAIEDLVFEPAVFESYDARVSFTVPSRTATMAQMTDNVTVRGTVDNVEVFNRTVAPGSKFEEIVKNLAEGRHTVGVELVYKGSTGEMEYADAYFGKDTPAKIAKVRLTATPGDNTKTNISWEAPTTGSHGSPYDQSKIRYRVVRYPDETVVKRSLSETSFIDNVTSSYSRIFYAVTPYNIDRPGEMGQMTTSNGIMAGTDIVPPYSESFDTASSMNSFTLIDVDGDGSEAWESPCWKYDDQYACAFYYGRRDINANDWLVTPPMSLDPDKLYKLTYKYYGYYGYGNHFQVAVGKEATDESLNRVIQDVERVTTQMDMPGIETSVMFAPHAGDRFIGFHHISQNMEHLSIDDIRLEVFGDSRIPEMPSGLSGIRLTSESLTLMFGMPTNNAGGKALEGELTARIYRDLNSEPVAVLTGLKPGQAVNWTDNNAVKGSNHYVVMAVNEYGDGLPAEITIDLSDAVPVAVASVRAEYLNDRQVVVSWDPVTSETGDNGNPVDVDEIRYLVYKPVIVDDYTELKLIGRDIEGSRFVDDDPLMGLSDMQQVVNYYVAPVNGAGIGTARMSGGVIVGRSYTLPFAETWFQQTQDTNPWSKIVNNGATWYIRHKGYDPMCDGQDGYGVLTCENNLDYTEGTGAIMSPRLDLTTMTKPELTFWYYRAPEYDSDVVMAVGVHVEGDEQYKYFPELYRPKADVAGWEKVTVDLSDYAAESRVSIVLIANIKENNLVHIDNFRVDGSANAGVVRGEFITGESVVRENAPYSYTATVRNFGTTDATNVKATLRANGKIVGEAVIPSISANGTAQAQFDFTPKAEHVGATQLSLVAGNSTLEAIKELDVKAFNPARVGDLKATPREESITLSWSVPSRTDRAQTAVDDFESYDSFIIEGIGGWKLYDGDGLVPFKFSDGHGGTLQWPNNDCAQAFMVFNPLMLPAAPDAASGFQYLINWGSPMGANNDWLISPELSGDKQMLSFFARSFAGGKEEFHVLVSRDSDDPADFISLTGNTPVVAGSDWTLYHYPLPEGIKHFAINYVGNRQDGLMIDDVLFNGYHNPVMPDGYNVYRDGRKLNESPLVARTYVDSDVVLGDEHTYVVRAVYNGVESSDSNEITTAASSIDTITDAAAAPVVNGSVGVITVENAEGLVVEIYRPDGSLVTRFESAGSDEVEAVADVYIVKVGNNVFKVAVR